LRKERRLRVFEISVLRRIFGPKRDEVTGDWRRLHTEESNDLRGMDWFDLVQNRDGRLL
jgi:hypothetical protein